MTRLFLVAAVLALFPATPAAAQKDELPTRLWSEYPLVQEVERASTPSIGPFLPPRADADSAPAAGGSSDWSTWAVVLGVGLLAVLVAVSVARATAAPTVAEPFPLRTPRGRERRTYAPGPLAQYAPTRTAGPADGLVEEPPRSIVLRTGLVRARYVVVADEWAGGLETVGGSRSFWWVGSAAFRQRLAEDAWDDLVNDLRVQGWEPNPLRRSEYYVLLQRIEPDSELPLRTAADLS